MSDLTTDFQSLLTVCILTEAFVEAVKVCIPKPLTSVAKNIFATIIGIVLCCILKVSLFQGDILVTYTGCIFAGVICSRGSNFLHELYNTIANRRKRTN